MIKQLDFVYFYSSNVLKKMENRYMESRMIFRNPHTYLVPTLLPKSISLLPLYDVKHPKYRRCGRGKGGASPHTSISNGDIFLIPLILRQPISTISKKMELRYKHFYYSKNLMFESSSRSSIFMEIVEN